MPFSPSLSIRFAFSCRDQQYTFTVLPQGYSNSLALCYNLVYKDLDFPCLPYDITLVHYIGDLLVIGPSEHEVATALDLLLRYLCARGQEINPTKMQRPPASMKFLEVQCCGNTRISLPG